MIGPDASVDEPKVTAGAVFLGEAPTSVATGVVGPVLSMRTLMSLLRPLTLPSGSIASTV